MITAGYCVKGFYLQRNGKAKRRRFLKEGSEGAGQQLHDRKNQMTMVKADAVGGDRWVPFKGCRRKKRNIVIEDLFLDGRPMDYVDPERRQIEKTTHRGEKIYIFPQ